MPILKFKDGKEEQAEEDGYSFKVEVVDGTGEVVDNGAKETQVIQVIGHLTMKKLKRLVTLLWTIAKIKMPLDLKNPHPMKIQIFGPFLQQLDAAIFHMEIQIILTNGLQIPKSICSYLKSGNWCFSMEDNRTFKINFSYWSYWIWSKGHFVCRPSFGSWIKKKHRTYLYNCICY